MYSYAFAHPMTGVRLAEVTPEVADVSWSTRMNSAGDATVTLQVRGSGVDRATWRDLTAHWSRALVVSWNGVPVYAGLVRSREWDARSGRLTLRLVEVAAMLSKRMVTGVSTYNPAGVLKLTNKSLRGLVRALVMAGLYRTDASPWWNFSLDVGADESGTHSRTYPHYELRSVDALVQEVRDSKGGPDIHFEPTWVAGKLVWQVRLGTPRLPGARFEWSQSVEESSVLDPTLLEDGAKMTTGTFVAGNGQEQSMRVGLGDPVDSDQSLTVAWPFRDEVLSHKHVEVKAELDALALENVERQFYPTKLKRFGLRIGDGVDPAALRLGSRVSVWTDGDEFEPEGWFDGYLVGLSGGTELTLGLEVVPL